LEDCQSKREDFFSEEKKQKTFTSLSRFCPAARSKETKVFCFFFSKKKCFLPCRLPDSAGNPPDAYFTGNSAQKL
jgi:hypothetical protein